MNRLDFWVYKNQKFPEVNILKKIEEDMFLDLSIRKKVNEKIELITKKMTSF
jgi:hypothetical protein